MYKKLEITSFSTQTFSIAYKLHKLYIQTLSTTPLIQLFVAID